MITNQSPTPTRGIVRIHPPLTEGDRHFDRQFIIGPEGEAGGIAMLAVDVPADSSHPAVQAEQALEGALMRVQGVRDACQQIRPVALALAAAAKAMGLGGAALRDLLAANGVRIEGKRVVVELEE